MSGHSKWATTKRQKEEVDAKRSGLFTKLSKNISVAAREGTDPKMNFKLRIAIDKAKAASMPKDNIERAVARGSGAGGGQLERVLYEGFGPEGIAVMVEAVTDNKNRTFSEIKQYFSRNGGNLGSANSVGWMFELRGVIEISSALTDEQELVLIDAGLLEVRTHGEGQLLNTELSKLQAVKERAEKLGMTVVEASTGYVAKELLTPKKEEAVLAFLDGLDELDDVDSIYTNANI
ncbi:MAG: YebC/PmpR family DNA-binding transcriptional regulator [Candidatus Komeilibacteria bacterium]|nr:YebC/PmpR family DNA-binding transcriptional regulator [Candidatus Komeilibacteria bacterium]